MPEFLIRPALLVLFLLGAWVVFKRPLTATEAMALNVMAAALAFMFGAWMLWRITPPEVRTAKPQIENRVWWLSALPLAFIGGIDMFNKHASIIILGVFGADSEVGIYRVAAQLSMFASFGLEAVNLAIAPRFAALYARRDMAKLQYMVTVSARIILAMNIGIALAYVLFGRIFLLLAFGSAYLDAYLPLLILLVGQAVNSAPGSVAAALNMTNHEQATVKGQALSTLLNILLNFMFIPLLGMNGAAVAVTVSRIAWSALMWWELRKRLGINSLAFKVRSF
jgi:O-antigen/teichoic acid export membrane protein